MNDLHLATKYIRKAQSSKDRGIEFDLPFTEFKRLYKRKRCYYTGNRLETDEQETPMSRTLDRVDSTRGYVSGNVVVCCKAANQLKSGWENPMTGASLEMAKQIVKKL